MLGQDADAAAETQNQLVGLINLLLLAAVTATEAGLAVKRVRQGSRSMLPAALSCCTKRFTADPMVIGVRMEPELERQLDRLAQQQGKTRSACIREAIQQYLLRHGDSEEARRQSEHLAQLEQPNWSEQVPDWSDWTA